MKCLFERRSQPANENMEVFWNCPCHLLLYIDVGTKIIDHLAVPSCVQVSFRMPRNLISSTPLPTGRTSSKSMTAVFNFVLRAIEEDWHTEPCDGVKVACDRTSS